MSTTSCLREAAVRFSPQRTTVFFPKPFVQAADESEQGTALRSVVVAALNEQADVEVAWRKCENEEACEELLSEHNLSFSPPKSPVSQSSSATHHQQAPPAPSTTEAARDAAKSSASSSSSPTSAMVVATKATPEQTYTEDGLPILAMHSCTIPDPSISTAGHAVASLYFYGCFVLAVAYAIWRFVSFEEIVAVSMPLTSTLGLGFPLHLNVTCDLPTNVTLLVNYSASASSPPCLGIGNVSSTVMGIAFAGGSVSFPFAPLCYTFQDAFIFSDKWPSLTGIALAFDAVPWGSSCQVAIEATVPTGGGLPMLHTLGVEGGMVKSFFMSYTDVSIVQDKNRIASASLEPVYYELDAVRSTNNVDWGLPGADTSSVVAFRLTEVSRHISRNDYRTVFKFLGFFGQVWGLVGKAMLVLGPLLVISCPRDFVADAKAGRIEGYTKFLLDDAWKPGTLAGFGLDLYTRVKALTHSK